MKNLLFLLFLLTTFYNLNGQNNAFYNDIGNNLMFYTQINKDPVIISNGQLLSESTLPNYTKGLQFLQAPGLFNSVSNLYYYLTNNNTFNFQNSDQQESYYNKGSTHIAQREQYYNDGLEVYAQSLNLTSDEAVHNSGIYDLISDVRYQVILQETYIKDVNYEFLILTTLNVLESNIDLNVQSDLDKVSNILLRLSPPSEIENFKKNFELYCLIKEDGIWKACSFEAHLKYLEDNNLISTITNKISSNNFYDIISTIKNGNRVYATN